MIELVDAGHTILECSSCRKQLVDLWLVNPDDSKEMTVVAHCGHCGDKSFKKTLKGGPNSFKVGHTESSIIVDVEYNPDNPNIIIKTCPI